MPSSIHSIIISRTDNLGDVMLTLPLCGILKEHFPACKLYFIGKAYTRSVIECCPFVDEFIDVETLHQNHVKANAILFVYPDLRVAKWAVNNKIPLRIGTSHRLMHWLYANKRVHFTRKYSHLHEAQLNALLLKPLNIPYRYTLPELTKKVSFVAPPNSGLMLVEQPFVLLHPKSKGSAREWPLENYAQLALILKIKGYKVGITGTYDEGNRIKHQMPEFFTLTKATDLTGKLTLHELIWYISRSIGLVACSTGPLHIAAALGVKAVGLYPSVRPMHAGRWGALGTQVSLFYNPKECARCPTPHNCPCIQNLSVQPVAEIFETLHTA